MLNLRHSGASGSPTIPFNVNSLNQVTDAHGVAYHYDANGNLSDDGLRTYQWDADNRLLQIGYPAQPARTTQFRYDGLGRRVAIISKNGTTTSESRYLWCGASLCQGRTGSDVVSRRYYAEGEVRPAGGTLLYYSRDHLGSVRDLLNVYNGARVASFDYDAYGKTTKSNGRLSPDFRYAGMFYLQEAGLYLTQYRAYDPNTGRWLSRDPIGENGGVNLYTYVLNNPLRWIDPFGLEPFVSYPDSKSAGEQAVRDINPTSIKNGVEYAGRLCSYTYVMQDGCFYTPPNKGGKDWSYDGVCPYGTSAKGTYHTHGSYDPKYFNERFSPEDKANLDKDNQTGYLGTPKGIIKSYTPDPNIPLGGQIQMIGDGAK